MFPCCFGGANWCYSQWDNDATFANIFTAINDGKAASYSSAIVADGTDTIVGFQKIGGTGTSGPIARRLDSSGSTVHDFETQNGSPSITYSIGVDSSSNVWLPIRYNASYAAYHLRKYDSSGVASGGALCDSTSETVDACTCDSSDNVYCISYITVGFSTTVYVYKFNSSGTKQWRTAISVMGFGNNQKIWIDTAGDVWALGNGTLARLNSAGTIQSSATIATAAVVNSDGGTGAAVADGTNVKILDGAMATVISIAETDNGAICADSSNNVYVAGRTGTKPALKVWDSSLTSIYTKTNIGTNYVAGGGRPMDIIADSSYVWMAGWFQLT